MQSQMGSHPQFPGSPAILHHQLQQHSHLSQSFQGVTENGKLKNEEKGMLGKNYYETRPNSKDLSESSGELKADVMDQQSDNETDVDSSDSQNLFAGDEKRSVPQADVLGEVASNDSDHEDSKEKTTAIVEEDQKLSGNMQDPLREERASKKRRRHSSTKLVSARTSGDGNSSPNRAEKRSNFEEKENENGENMELEESGSSRGGSESPVQTEIKLQKPLGLLAQHGLASGPGSKTLSSTSSSQRHQHHYQQQLQQRQQILLQQQRQHQQHYGSFFSGARKSKIFENEMGFNPFAAFSLKADPDRSAADIYRNWNAFKDQEEKHKKSPSKEATGDDDDFESGPDKDGRNDTSFCISSKENGEDRSRSVYDSAPASVDASRQILLTDRRFMPSPPPTSSPVDKSESSGHHWTFEEQFKQLYEMSGDPKRKEFLDDLFLFMQKRGTPVNRIPIMAKQTLDLYELFRLVISKGGLVEVINKKLWREITKGLNLPSSITSAAFTLRTQYMKYLYPYECEKLKLSSLSELQSAIDGNRREGRRPGFDFSPFPPLMPGPGAPHLANLLGPLPLTPGGPVHGSRNAPLGNCVDERQPPPFFATSAMQQLHMGGHFRSMMAEHDARIMHEAATRAMEEVAKKVEESTRSALVQPASVAPSSMKFEDQGSIPNTPLQLAQNSSPNQSNKRPNFYEDPGRSSRFSSGGPPLHHGNSHHSQPQQHLQHQTSRIKITSQNNGCPEADTSMSVSMEINGTMYHGVLFATPHQIHI